MPVRVLTPDAEIRMLCFHYWKHRGMRLLWVCDLAMILESHGGSIDWAAVEVGSRFDRDRVQTPVRVARHLLDCDPPSIPTSIELDTPPDWLAVALYEQWANTDGYPNEALKALAARPGRVLRILTERWSGPIQATVHTRAPFNAFPRGPIQLAGYGLKIVEFAFREFPRQLRRYYRSA